MKYHLLLLLLLAPLVSAAPLPIVVNSNPHIVQDAIISHIYLSRLDGGVQSFIISNNKSFALYVQLDVPDLPNATVYFTAEIYQNGTLLKTIETDNVWDYYHDSLSNDDYMIGPYVSLDKAVGDYEIKVYNKKNEGRFALIIGSEDSASLTGFIDSLQTLKDIKKYNGREMSTLLGGIVSILIAIIFVLIPIAIWSIVGLWREA